MGLQPTQAKYTLLLLTLAVASMSFLCHFSLHSLSCISVSFLTAPFSLYRGFFLSISFLTASNPLYRVFPYHFPLHLFLFVVCVFFSYNFSLRLFLFIVCVFSLPTFLLPIACQRKDYVRSYSIEILFQCVSCPVSMSFHHL